MNLVQEKRCSRCGEVKPRSEFGPNRHSPTGLASECRPCKAAAQRESYAKKKKDNVLPRRRRRPLPESAADTGRSLRRDVERFERIFADDRFPAHKQQVAARVRGHLQYAAEVCQDLLSRLDHPTGG